MNDDFNESDKKIDDDSLNRQVEEIESLEKDTSLASVTKLDSSIDSDDSSKEQAMAEDDNTEDSKTSQDVARLLSDDPSDEKVLNDDEKIQKMEDIKKTINNSPKKNTGLKISLSLAIVVALIGAGLSGWFYMDLDKSKKEIATLMDKQNSYDKEKSDLNSKVTTELNEAKQKASEEAIAQERQYRIIPEFSIRYKLNDDNKDFIYALTVSDDSSGKSSEKLHVSTRSLANMKVAGSSNQTYPCDAQSASVGVIERIPEESFDKATDSTSSIAIKKIGKFYIKFYNAQGICSSNVSSSAPEFNNIQKSVNTARDIMKKTIESMEEVK